MSGTRSVARWLVAAVGLACLLAAQPARAQVGEPQVWSTLRFSGEHPVVLHNRWAPGAAKKTGGVRLVTSAGQVRLPGDGFVRTAMAVREQQVLVAVAQGGARPSVRLALVELGADGAPGQPRVIVAPRQAQAGYRPAAVVACADPQGFTVLWQEQRLDAQGGRPDARSYLARLDPKGNWLVKPKTVAVPWALGAIVHNGKGYHLALYFDGGGAAHTRLCGVTLSAAGQPEQHPWWASAQLAIDEVQLVRLGGSIQAFFRGGSSGSELWSTELTTPGQWGAEPGAATSRGTVGAAEEFTVRAKASGQPEIVRRAL